ncbi:MAG: cation:proton antiporter [Alphaproteobacteria bacterium]|jgi:Kef-type K+ transport system membrane component KefB|nr:cation:proton antiporter [Alphaproteobacteria bacterium]
MSPLSQHLTISVLAFGVVIIAAIVTRNALRRIGVPPLVGFVVIGLLIGLCDHFWPFMDRQIGYSLHLLGELGLFALLFRVGLDSNLPGLVRQLRRASVIWFGNVVVSGGAGFIGSRYALGLELVPSIFVAVAFTATSIGISLSVWQEAAALRSRNGELLTDVAELDDLSAIVFMIILFSVLPYLNGSAHGSSIEVAGHIGAAVGWAVLKMVLFGGACVLFSRFAERPITRFVSRFEPVPDPMLVIVGIGVVIAAVAGLLGFSLAVGALFAGLVFSRDPQAVRIESSFVVLYELFVPFFFIAIGLQVDWATLGPGITIGAVLLAFAVVGKFVGAWVPARLTCSAAGASLIAVSMVPRAEIAFVIAREGMSRGPWSLPAAVFSGVVFVSLITALVAPVITRVMLTRWPNETLPEEDSLAPRIANRPID